MPKKTFVLCSFLLVFVLFTGSAVFAQQRVTYGINQIREDLEEVIAEIGKIEKKLETLDKKADRIEEKQKEILEQIQVVKIWVRKHG